VHDIDLNLPFTLDVDREIDLDGMRTKVDKLIEQEMKRTPRREITHLPANVELFKDNDLLLNEFLRTQQQRPQTLLSTARYELPPPHSYQMQSLDAWEAAVNNSKAQLESQTLRLFNLELLQKFGANAWRVHNYQLEGYQKQLQGILDDQKAMVTELNKQRKFEQTQAAGSLSSLEARWTELISQTVQVEVACVALGQEVAALEEQERRMRETMEISEEENGA